MTSDPEIIPLADEEPLPQRGSSSAPRQQRDMPRGEIDRGQPSSTASRSAPARVDGLCPGCGYSLRGLPLVATRCPECATLLPSPGRRSRSAESAAAVAAAWREPLWYLVPALLATIVMLLVMDGPVLALIYLVAFTIMLPVLLGAFLLCCSLWIGCDAPWPLALLRLAAVQAVCDAAWFAGVSTGIPLLPILLGAVAFLAMMVKLMEIDTVDALLVGVAGLVLKAAAGYALLGILT